MSKIKSTPKKTSKKKKPVSKPIAKLIPVEGISEGGNEDLLSTITPIEKPKAKKVQPTIVAKALSKTKREIKFAFIHCSATPDGVAFDVHTIRTWHKANGWSDIGYHFVIHLDGTISEGRPIDIMGAHTKGYNKKSIGICYIGGTLRGKPMDTRTPAQKRALKQIALECREKGVILRGHNQVSDKACPCFDVAKEYK